MARVPFGEGFMPRITQDMCERIWEVYKRRLSYTSTGKELGMDRRTVKRCVERKKEQLARSEVGQMADEGKAKETRARAFKMLKNGKGLGDIAIGLKLGCKEAKFYYEEWLQITNRQKILDMCSEIGEDELGRFLELYEYAKLHGADPDELLKPLKGSKSADSERAR
jgi:IS30 family transposase